jgi:hydroxymethylglutaryl-CoA reductase
MSTGSRIPGFYRLSTEQRRAALLERSPLDPADLSDLDGSALSIDRAGVMVENVVGTFALPLGIAVNLRINDDDLLVPMAVEEPSVVAAVSNMARLVRRSGGFTASCDDGVMLGQVQLTELPDVDAAEATLREATPALCEAGARCHPRLVERGGGMRGASVRRVVYDEPGQRPETMLVFQFRLDCVDAMGANMVNTVAEALAPRIEDLTGGRVRLRILSNLASERLARASCALPVAHLAAPGAPDSGAAVAEGIASAYRFAWADPWRAATHNKGVMNGIDAVALATGNDWRAIEAGAHAWAARDGQYRSLTRWVVEDGVLHGSIELPMQVGTVGGPIRNHPGVRTNLKLMDVTRARELSAVMAAVGLAQNLGALRALATEGIQQGHMRMHARNVAVQAGAGPDELATVVEAMCAVRDWSESRAREALRELRGE